MSEASCGAATKNGGRCHFPKYECHWHGKGLAGAAEPVVDPPQAMASRDVRELGWWTIEHTIRGDLQPNRGTVISTIMRDLAAMDAEPLAEDELLREVELRGISRMESCPAMPKVGSWPQRSSIPTRCPSSQVGEE